MARIARLALVLVASALLAPGLARADPRYLEPQPEEPIRRPLRVPLIVAENLLILAPPTIYYYATTNLQREDFELDWDWPSWRTKLTTFDAVILDTGNWESNALRHPLAGELSYQAMRAGGYDPMIATGVDLLSGALWEYLVEYREQISLNDLVVNTISGYLLGEPLFQLGRIADTPGSGLARTALAWVASPFHRLHAALGYASWRPLPRPWTRFVLTLGAGTVDHGDHVRRAESSVGLDIELVRDPRFGVPGYSTGRLHAATWNRVGVELRGDGDGVTRIRARSRTTYGGRYWHHQAREDGQDVLIDLAAGIDYDTRRLADETDRLIAFHVVAPHLRIDRWRGAGRLTWELGVAADLGMVQAHVFGPVPPFPLLPQTSVLQSRGYYYGFGGSLSSRLTAHLGRWHAGVEVRGHQLWSIDGRDRHELDGAVDDPHDVSDRRLYGEASAGLDLTDRIHLVVAGEAVLRQGWWADQARTTHELDLGAWVGLDF